MSRVMFVLQTIFNENISSLTFASHNGQLFARDAYMQIFST